MKIILTSLLFFISPFSFAQFAIIQDSAGFCNVIDSANDKSKVIDTLNNGHFVYAFGRKAAWINIDYTKKKKDLRGYVYYAKIKSVSDFDSLPVVSEGENTITLAKDSLKIIITRQNFVRGNSKLVYYKEAKGQIETINGKPIWGTDGEMPRSEYGSFIIFIGQRKVILPKSAFANLFEPRLSDTQIHYDKLNNTVYIQSANSDGAGYYQVIWKIQNGVYKDRYVASAF